MEALLLAAALPLDGVAEHFEHFLVIEVAGVVVGAAGLELYGDYALLRSVVVSSERRRVGCGERLIEAIRDEARSRGVRALYLLTTTAETYFAQRGFTRVPRAQIPADVRASREFVEACPASATAMLAALT